MYKIFKLTIDFILSENDGEGTKDEKKQVKTESRWKNDP